MFNFIIYLCLYSYLFAPATLYTRGNSVATKRDSGVACNSNFAKPITFTQPGLGSFVKQVYNHPDYADFLAHNMYHITQFVHKMSPYPCSALQMFGNKFKQVTCINPYAFADLLDEITPLLKSAVTYDTQNNVKKQLSKAMYDQMLYKFDYLKQDPHAYFNELTDTLITIVYKNPITDAQRLEINKAVLTFLEITINKLVWHPNEYQNAWKNVLHIADLLNNINQDILHNRDDLNALFITLLERFYLFLDLSYAEIPVDFYLDLRKQAAEQPPLLLTAADTTLNCNGLLVTSECFQTKLQRFEKIVTLSEAKTRAYNEGIYAQHYIPPWKQG